MASKPWWDTVCEHLDGPPECIPVSLRLLDRRDNLYFGCLVEDAYLRLIDGGEVGCCVEEGAVGFLDDKVHGLAFFVAETLRKDADGAFGLACDAFLL